MKRKNQWRFLMRCAAAPRFHVGKAGWRGHAGGMMDWSNLDPRVDVHVPDGAAPRAALERTTHLAIGAHPDDLEIFALHGIERCYRIPDQWFTGITVTDGAGSPRTGIYGEYSDAEMVAVRRREQRQAAVNGEYGLQLQLGLPSAEVKTAESAETVEHTLAAILEAARPGTVYLHNPADKHETHLAVLSVALKALIRIRETHLPDAVYGCEVWRDLDWLPDGAKIALEAGGIPHLAQALIGIYDSQIRGGKRYDLAAAGRRLANATFHASHGTDDATGITWAMDLRPVVTGAVASPRELVEQHLESLRCSCSETWMKFW